MAVRQLKFTVGVDGVAQGVGRPLQVTEIIGRAIGNVTGIHLVVECARHADILIHRRFQRGGQRRFLAGIDHRRIVGIVLLHGLQRLVRLGHLVGAQIAGGQQGLGLAFAIQLEVLGQAAQRIGGRQPVGRHVGRRGIDRRQAIDGKSAKRDHAGEDEGHGANDAQADGHVLEHKRGPYTQIPASAGFR